MLIERFPALNQQYRNELAETAQQTFVRNGLLLMPPGCKDAKLIKEIRKKKKKN